MPIVVVFLSKKLYSHCSSLPSCIMGTWWPGVNWGEELGEGAHPAVVPGVNWGNSPPGVNCKYQLSMSHIVGEGPGGTSGTHSFTCEAWHVQPPAGYQPCPRRTFLHQLSLTHTVVHRCPVLGRCDHASTAAGLCSCVCVCVSCF